MVDVPPPSEVSEEHKKAAVPASPSRRRFFIGGAAAAGAVALAAIGLRSERKPSVSLVAEPNPSVRPAPPSEKFRGNEQLTTAQVAHARSELAVNMAVGHIPFLEELYSANDPRAFADHLQIQQDGLTTVYTVLHDKVGEDPMHPNYEEVTLRVTKDTTGKVVADQIHSRIVGVSESDGHMRIIMQQTDSARANMTNMDEHTMRATLREAIPLIPDQLQFTPAENGHYQLTGKGETRGHVGGGRSVSADTTVQYHSNGSLDVRHIYP